jgi:hypothetical protein
VYTQVVEFNQFLELPHPNPPLALRASRSRRVGEVTVSPLCKGGLRGVIPRYKKKTDLCVHGSPTSGEGWGGVLLLLLDAYLHPKLSRVDTPVTGFTPSARSHINDT